jgi:hypothetical protein
MPQRRLCSLCNIFLLEPREHNICPECQIRTEIDRLTEWGDCPRCGRYSDCIFDCGWCGMTVCDGCLYDEHNDDDCSWWDDGD